MGLYAREAVRRAGKGGFGGGRGDGGLGKKPTNVDFLEKWAEGGKVGNNLGLCTRGKVRHR